MSELKYLEFSTPEPRYESFASFENEKGQQFIIRVRGCDRAAVEQYTSNLSAYLELELLPNESIQRPQEESFMPEGEAEQLLLQEETIPLEQIITPQSTRDIEVAFKVAKASDIKKPHLLNFRLGDIQEVPINEGDSPQRTIYQIGKKPKVEVNVSAGKVRFELVEVEAKSGKKRTIAAKDVSGFYILNARESERPGYSYYVRATGLEKTNEYIINGTKTVVSLSDVKEEWL